MKTIFLSISIVIITFQTYAQSVDNYEFGMVFIPKGSFSIKIDSVIRTISVDAFWMSDEISNKQFREFTDYAILHPNDSLTWIELDKNYNLNKKIKIKGSSYKQLCIDLIDSSALSKEFTVNSKEYNKYKYYFTDKTFENYPVVGVSYNSARLYCLWLTLKDKEINRKEGTDDAMDYRLPLDAEWSYAADMAKNSEDKCSNELQNIRFGRMNKIGLYNIYGNVSEWTQSSSDKENYAVVGSSWKNNQTENRRLAINKNTKTSYIGFRIVKTYKGKN